ncbi:Transposable element Tcb1 transposase [Dictyocoela muelleri]|nr:Transposable element Tcb1 transposase [Dictyocoela muelleri]
MRRKCDVGNGVCFSFKGVGEITFFEGKIDRFVYPRIFRCYLASSAEKMGLKKYIFQHYNDPKHSSKHVKQYSEDKNIDVMIWFSQSLDLNPVEHLLVFSKKRIGFYKVKNLTELKAVIVKEWNNIDVYICGKLVYSMKRRSKRVLEAKGYHGSY